MAKPPDRYVSFLIEQFSALGEIHQRSMFGGHCLYCDGTVFGLVANGELYLKADEVNAPAFVARGLKGFQPFDDPKQTMSYYQAPPEIFEDPEAMRNWVGGAVACGLRKAKKSKKTR
jgi:DNA transformation protein and related proteins